MQQQEVEIDDPVGEPRATLPTDPNDRPPEMASELEVPQLPVPTAPNEV